jgi:hypothetical protein
MFLMSVQDLSYAPHARLCIYISKELNQSELPETYRKNRDRTLTQSET